jgi:hypothetical protein
MFFVKFRLTAIHTLMEAFGNSRTVMNANATRFTQIFSVDFDHSGLIVSASVQVTGVLYFIFLLFFYLGGQRGSPASTFIPIHFSFFSLSLSFSARC